MTRRLTPQDLTPVGWDAITEGAEHALIDRYLPEPSPYGPKPVGHVDPRKVTVVSRREWLGQRRIVLIEAHDYIAHVPTSWHLDEYGYLQKWEDRPIHAGERRYVPPLMIGPLWESIVPFLNYAAQLPKRRSRVVQRAVQEGLMGPDWGDLGRLDVDAAAFDVLLDELEVLRANAADYQDAISAAETARDERGAA